MCSEKSFASASYLITRPDGNVMIDSPRFNPVLAKQIAKLGGVKYLFLTHKWVVSSCHLLHLADGLLTLTLEITRSMTQSNTVGHDCHQAAVGSLIAPSPYLPCMRWKRDRNNAASH